MLTALKCTLGTITIFGIGFVTGVLAWDKFLWDELMNDLVDDDDEEEMLLSQIKILKHWKNT